MGCQGCPGHKQEEQEPDILVNIKIGSGLYTNVSFGNVRISGRMIEFLDSSNILRIFVLADNEGVVIESIEPLPR